MTPEGRVDAHLRKVCKARGYEVRKLSYEGRINAPDRLVLGRGFHLFIELKRPGAVARPGQVRELERLRAAGAIACVCDSEQAVDNLFKTLEDKA